MPEKTFGILMILERNPDMKAKSPNNLPRFSRIEGISIFSNGLESGIPIHFKGYFDEYIRSYFLNSSSLSYHILTKQELKYKKQYELFRMENADGIPIKIFLSPILLQTTGSDSSQVQIDFRIHLQITKSVFLSRFLLLGYDVLGKSKDGHKIGLKISLKMKKNSCRNLVSLLSALVVYLIASLIYHHSLALETSPNIQMKEISENLFCLLTKLFFPEAPVLRNLNWRPCQDDFSKANKQVSQFLEVNKI